jgi:hypothetical protein
VIVTCHRRIAACDEKTTCLRPVYYSSQSAVDLQTSRLYLLADFIFLFVIQRTLVQFMALTPQSITDAELSVLQVIWERQTATVRELTERLYPEGTAAHHATVQKLLERLERPGRTSSRR